MTAEGSNISLPRGWTAVTLDEICEKITDGTHFTPTYVDDGVPFLSVKDIFDGKTSFDDCRFISTEEHAKLTKRCNPEYLDVLITKSGTIGRTAVVNTSRPFSLFVSVALIKPFKKHVDSSFLALSLKNYINNISIQQSVKGGVIKNLHIEDLKKIRISFPPFGEQVRIVARLEELFARLDAGVEGVRKVKAQLKRYRQAVLKYAFEGKLTEEWRKTHRNQMEPATKLLQQIKQEIGDSKDENHVQEQLAVSAKLPKLPETWIWTTIGEVETFIGSGITPRGGRRVYVDRGIPFIRSQNVHADGLRLKDIVYVTQEQHAEMERTHTKPNDVLLNITGASIGRSAYIPQELDKANVNQHVCIVRTGWWIVPSYLSHFLNSSYGQDQIFQTQSGVTRQGLNYAQVRNLRIPLAPLPEQNLMVDKIEEMLSSAHDFEKTIIRSLAQTERLRLSILKTAFEGKLVLQDLNDEPAEKLLERIKAERAKSKGEKDTNKGRKNKPKQLELNTYVK